MLDVIAPHFRPKRHRLSVTHYRAEREQRFQVWHEITIAYGPEIGMGSVETSGNLCHLERNMLLNFE
jgi:hypothetical protein